MIQIIFKVLRYRLNRFIVEDDYFKHCARCEDCGRIVKDFSVPDELWIKVYGSCGGILCYTCFRWRMVKQGLNYITNFECKPI